MTDSDARDHLDDAFFDRIVDGGLTPGELRGAINRLDREPDGWKRCAVAFLEAQCWRESMRAMEESTVSTAAARSFAVPQATAFSMRVRHRWLRGPIAAGIIAASFALGWLGHASRPTPAAGQSTLAAAAQPVSASAIRVGPLPAIERSDDQYRQRWTDVARPVMRVRVGSESAQADVPILAGPGINEEWLRNQPPPVNEHSLVVLQQHGYQVDQRRRLITTTLPDGRRVAVPIDQVQIRYTGNNPL
jgi:hypothetical protein